VEDPVRHEGRLIDSQLAQFIGIAGRKVVNSLRASGFSARMRERAARDEHQAVEPLGQEAAWRCRR
jgi:hypothetical protein